MSVVEKVKAAYVRFTERFVGFKAAALSTLNSLIGFGLGLTAAAALLAQIQVNGQPVVEIPAEYIVYLTTGIAFLRTLVAALNPFDPSFGIGANHPVQGVPQEDLVLEDPVDVDVDEFEVLPDDAVGEAVDQTLPEGGAE